MRDCDDNPEPGEIKDGVLKKKHLKKRTLCLRDTCAGGGFKCFIHSLQ